MRKPQGVIISFVKSVTSFYKNRNNRQSKFKKYYNPCFLVLMKYFVSWRLGNEKQEEDEIFGLRCGLLYLTTYGGRKEYT